MADTDSFAHALAFVIDSEGGLTTDPDDPGNWTGGKVGFGLCRGTKFGISAAAYPGLDIASLTCDEAATIYRRDYWARIEGDTLPQALALIVFDATVNAGVEAATCWLQRSLGVGVDGALGPATLAAARAANLPDLCARYQAMRLAALPNAPRFLAGWRLRILRATLIAGGMLDAA